MGVGILWDGRRSEFGSVCCFDSEGNATEFGNEFLVHAGHGMVQWTFQEACSNSIEQAISISVLTRSAASRTVGSGRPIGMVSPQQGSATREAVNLAGSPRGSEFGRHDSLSKFQQPISSGVRIGSWPSHVLAREGALARLGEVSRDFLNTGISPQPPYTYES
ncbi:hypothetical protein OIU85_004519 [Salix viminalis]|uniref:Uncharacterized protein n=1 Tax=Salix viminalis TaxID=40686 RepID=A0A9Q0PTH9_SALVM|nr:hypothetical protein OIU85_004519 [Salix viminalis]